MPHPHAMRTTGLRTALVVSCLLLVASVGLADGGHDDAGHADHGHGDNGDADNGDAGHDEDRDAHDDHGAASGGHGEESPHDHAHQSAGNLTDYVADVSFTLRTAVVDGRLAFVGVGGDIDGIANPDLMVAHGDIVEIVLENGDGIEHDIVFEDFEAASAHTFAVGEQATFAFRAHHVGPGSYTYTCTMPGHRAAGQEGTIVVVGD